MDTQPKKVLLLTDSGTVNQMLKGTLHTHGYAVTLLQSGNAQFFQMIVEAQPDIIFLRTELTHANGLEVCDRIKKEPTLVATRVVFLSSNPKVREQAIEHRADRFLTMPFSPADVLETAAVLSVVKPVILYVDDSDLMHRTVVPPLKEEGYEVIEAWDGREATEIIDERNGRIDMILSDVEMPVMDGITLCKNIRATRTEDIPFMLLTSLDTAEAVERGFGAGADDYITKPVLVQEMLSRVKRLLKSGRQEAVVRPERILLVDDSPVIRGMMLTALRSHGFHADAVEHGVAAMAKLRERRYDLMVSDYDMPHMNGLELCMKVRQEPSSWQQIPIIFVTARDAKADEVRVRSLGVQAFITKPFNADRFLAETERVLSEVHLQRHNRMFGYYFADHASKPNDVLAIDQFRTVLCVGLADFRAMSKRLDPRALITTLHHYLATLSEVLEKCEVLVDRIQEDHLFISFGNQDKGAMQAIECARAMHKAVPELQRRCGNAELKLQTGIHSGRLILGSLESFSSRERTITLIGDSVELARGVQQVAPVGEVVLSETTFALVQTLVKTQPIGYVKTQEGAIRAFQVLA
ncbi:MAG: response regulator [Magnetococcales bacterium]|nr:response regulator [Magnetococcales bacterium]